MLDANLLLLFLVGQVAPRSIGIERGVKEFVQEDFILLKEEIIDAATALYTMPSIVTEVSNLVRAGDRERIRGITAALGKWVLRANEEYVESRAIVSDPVFSRFGLTDAGLKIVLSRGILLVTVDRPLAGLVEKLKFDVLNFNHLRFRDLQG